MNEYHRRAARFSLNRKTYLVQLNSTECRLQIAFHNLMSFIVFDESKNGDGNFRRFSDKELRKVASLASKRSSIFVNLTIETGQVSSKLIVSSGNLSGNLRIEVRKIVVSEIVRR